MSPPRTRFDPEGYYARLGLEPGAAREAVAAAFRARVRVLHPDVPGTGNAAAFVAVKQAYDVLSNADRRQDYDQAAQRAAAMARQDTFTAQPAHPAPPVHPARPATGAVPSQSNAMTW